MSHGPNSRFLSRFFYFVLILGGVVVASFFDSQDEELKAHYTKTTGVKAALAVVPVEPGPNKQRFPATSARDTARFDLPELCNFAPNEKPYFLSTQSQWIQIRGGSCFKEAIGDFLKVSNTTNGFKASLFNIKRGRFHSDLIQLLDGENRILFELSDPKKKGPSKTFTLVVTSRRMN